MHRSQSPNILYFGKPVALISRLNAGGIANFVPISSIFWFGWSCMIGLAARSRTTENLLRYSEAELNLPSEQMAGAVDRLALTTGSEPVANTKLRRGYVHCADKFARAVLSQEPSETIAPPRVGERSVQRVAKLRLCTGSPNKIGRAARAVSSCASRMSRSTTISR